MIIRYYYWNLPCIINLEVRCVVYKGINVQTHEIGVNQYNIIPIRKLSTCK